jgi:hypothetical protein
MYQSELISFMYRGLASGGRAFPPRGAVRDGRHGQSGFHTRAAALQQVSVLGDGNISLCDGNGVAG